MTMAKKKTRNLKTLPLANLLPMMSDAEFQQLLNDIEDRGVLEPVVIHKGRILDGRNRYRACKELNVECPVRGYDGPEDQLAEYVMSANLQRRQLKPSQRAAISVRLLPEIREEVHRGRAEKLRNAAKNRKEKAIWGDGEWAKMPTGEKKKIRARAIVADMLGISDRLVADALMLQDRKPAALKDVEAGKISLGRALKPHRDRDETRGRPKKDKLVKATAALAVARRELQGQRELLALLKPLEEAIKLKARDKK